MKNIKLPTELFIFFPGKGIFDLVSSKLIIEIYKKNEVEKIFEVFSKLIINEKKLHYSTEIIAKAKKLFNYSKIILKISNDKKKIDFFLNNIKLEKNRISVNNNKINWNELENKLKKLKFIVKKKSIFPNGFNYPCSLHIIFEPNGIAIGEGKGLTDRYSIKSALAETVERLVSKEPINKQIIINSYENLYKNKNWTLNFEVGPRDTYNKKIITEWIKCHNISRNDLAFIPAEIAYLDYSPKLTKIRLFSLHHTTGLSCGSSFEDASINGILEVLERDAYWNIMRTRKNCPTINLDEVENLDPKIKKIINFLKKKKLELVLKDFSLDWEVPIVHAIIISKEGKIPAFSHGSGASFSWNIAITRAVTEAVQMYSGLSDVTDKMWNKIVSVKEVLGNCKLAWSDPLMAPQLEHLYKKSNKKWNKKLKIVSVENFIKKLFSKGHECISAPLGEINNLKVVRVIVTNTTQPDERLERIGDRLKQFQKIEKLNNGLYNDPILT